MLSTVFSKVSRLFVANKPQVAQPKNAYTKFSFMGEVLDEPQLVVDNKLGQVVVFHVLSDEEHHKVVVSGELVSSVVSRINKGMLVQVSGNKRFEAFRSGIKEYSHLSVDASRINNAVQTLHN